MRILIDILHPAHVHFFKHFYQEMRTRGHELRVTARAKDRAPELLQAAGIPHTLISHSTIGPLRQAGEFVVRGVRLARFARAFRPDVLAGIMGPSIAVVGKLLRVPAYVFYDTEIARSTNRWVYPLAAKVVTPDCYQEEIGPHHVRYAGYHELAYLHPVRFTPRADLVEAAGIDPLRPYSLVRFVGWHATHDRGQRGLSPEQKLRLIEHLRQFGPVVISSEGEVPEALRPLVYRGPVDHMHHVQAHAGLFYGESATMASECAVLGVPAVFISPTRRGYTDDQQRYGLVHNFHPQQFEASLECAGRILADPIAARRQAAEVRARLLAQKLDVTQYLVELFEHDFGRVSPARQSLAPTG